MHVILGPRDPRGFNIRTPYTPDRTAFDIQLELIKRPLGTKWDKKAKTWYIDGAEALLDFERCGITYSVPDACGVQAIRRFQHELHGAVWARDLVVEGQYGFQTIGAQYLRWAKLAILADDMGLGKTRQTIEGIRHVWDDHGPLPTLVVVLKTKLYDWPEEFELWQPGLAQHVSVIPDAPAARKTYYARLHELSTDNAPIVVCNYEKLAMADFPWDYGWRIIAADEATYIKNPRAQRSRAFHTVAQEAEWAWLLTGTPIEIRLEELYGLFSYIRPAVFGTFPRFRDAHLIADYNGTPIGIRDRVLLAERTGPWILRRTKEDVKLQLPPKLHNNHEVEFTKQEQDGYSHLLHDFDSWLAERGEDETGANALTQLLRLRQFTCSPNLLDPEAERGSKFSALRDIVNEWDGQAVVFTHFAEMADRLQEWLELPDDAIIKGAVANARERKRRIDDFNAGKLGKVLISTDAGAYGLNIQSADLMVHYDMLWNPAKLRQREDRLHRIGQTKPVNVLRLLVTNTVDFGMYRVTNARQAEADAIIDAADEVITKRINYAKVARGEYGTQE